MNYFLQLLVTLTPHELQLVETLRLTPTERRIFEYLLLHAGSGKDQLEAATAALELTHNSFYKNCSILLRKAYGALVPEGGLRLLEYLLKRKSLIQNGLRELERQERTFGAQTSREDKRFFYLAVFHLLRSAERVEIPMPYFVQYGQRYLMASVRNDADEELAIHIYLEQRQFTKDLKQTAKRFDTSYQKQYLESLHTHAQTLAASTNRFAKYNLHTAYYNYYSQTRSDVTALRYHLDELLSWLPEEIDTHFPWVRSGRTLDQGSIDILMGDYEKANKFYSEHLRDLSPEYISIRVPMDYFLAAVWTGHYEKAQEIIFTIHRLQLENPTVPSRTSVVAEMWLGLLYLDWSRYDEARQHLLNATQWNHGEIYSRFNESIIRTLEIVLAFFTLDWDYAEQLISRNRQWLRRNEFTEANSSEFIFTELAKAYLDHILCGKPLKAEQEELRQSNFRTESAGLFGKLLGKMRALAESSALIHAVR